jgi:hypothetical protein
MLSLRDGPWLKAEYRRATPDLGTSVTRNSICFALHPLGRFRALASYRIHEFSNF